MHQRPHLCQICGTGRVGADDHQVQTGGQQAEDDRGGVDERVAGSTDVQPEILGHQDGGVDHHHHQQRIENPRDEAFQRCGSLGERPAAGDPGVDEPVSADPVGQEPCSSRHAVAAGQYFLAGLDASQPALAGDHGGVDDQAAVADDVPVHLELVAGADDEQVTPDDLVGVDTLGSAVADHCRARSQGLLHRINATPRKRLLPGPDAGGGQRNQQRQQGTDPFAHQQLDQRQADDVQMEDGQDGLAAHQIARPGGFHARGVLLARGESRPGLGFGQADAGHTHRSPVSAGWCGSQQVQPQSL